MMRAIGKSFHLRDDDLVGLSTQNECFRKKTGSYDEKWLEKSETRVLKQFDDVETANSIMSRKEKKKKQYKRVQ